MIIRISPLRVAITYGAIALLSQAALAAPPLGSPVHVGAPPPRRGPGVPVHVAAPPRQIVAQSISSVLPKGNCDDQLILNADGSVQVRSSNGTLATVGPHGRIPTPGARQFVFETVPVTLPPDPKDPKLRSWLEHVQQGLLDEIEIRVGNQSLVKQYLNNEQRLAPTIYEKIERRIDTIERMNAR